MKTGARALRFESLERRRLMTATLHNTELPQDVNQDGRVTPLDALMVVNYLRQDSTIIGNAESTGAGATPPPPAQVDVNADSQVSPLDALLVINYLSELASQQAIYPGLLEDPPPADPPPEFDFANFPKAPGVGTSEKFDATLNHAESLGPQNLLNESEVQTLLRRASEATSSNDAIIAVVDRSGRILGVHVEDGVSDSVKYKPETLAFAIDGAVAKARTAAFFSSNAAPLTSRTVRFISQTTITQREVESAPTHQDPRYRGPGFVAPIGVGGHFPPEIPFTPQVDLFAIEHQSRDSRLNAGEDLVRGSEDDFQLNTRFNANPAYIPETAEAFFSAFPESFGVQAGTSPLSVSRGIATLPGGVPLYKAVTDSDGNPISAPLSKSINLVGGIGVFFPGEDGFATYEQGFRHQSENNGVAQSEASRLNAPKVLEAEAAAVIAAAGGGLVGPNAFLRDLSEFNNRLPQLPNFVLPTGRIDLVGITLEIFGPTPSRSFRQPGIDRLIQEARNLGPGVYEGSSPHVDTDGNTFLSGQSVPEGFLVAPRDSPTDPNLKAEDVERIIRQGIATAEQTRAAIRLDIDNNFRPGERVRMVFAVADRNGELLGLFRMNDATVFSIDVSIAKARNTAYYADADALVESDRVDFNGDGVTVQTSQSTTDPNGDTFPLGTALTNRSFRFLVEPRFPTGIELNPAIVDGLVNDPNVDLCQTQPELCQQVGPQSGLRLPGINPRTAENIDNNEPLSFEVYASPDHRSTVFFDAFNPSRNFRDQGDDQVFIAGTNQQNRLANQNGVVFFPGSTPLYVNGQDQLIGGFGVSGDGVDQDDVVTEAGQRGFAPDQEIRVDSFTIGGVRVPFQHFNRNPFGA